MLSILDIAEICHENNRAFCQSIGDGSQLPWSEAPQWQKDSACNGVKLHLFENHGVEASHEAWMKEKVDAGWTYGPVKDAMIKQHPCIVPHDQLSLNDKTKDYLFRAIVHACRPHSVDYCNWQQQKA